MTNVEFPNPLFTLPTPAVPDADRWALRRIAELEAELAAARARISELEREKTGHSA